MATNHKSLSEEIKFMGERKILTKKNVMMRVDKKVITRCFPFRLGPISFPKFRVLHENTLPVSTSLRISFKNEKTLDMNGANQFNVLWQTIIYLIYYNIEQKYKKSISN